MRRLPHVPLITTLFLGLVLIGHEPFRVLALSFLRLPLTLLQSSVTIILTLPQLPSLGRELTRLRTELIQRQVETAQLREFVRSAQQTDALFHTSAFPHEVAAAVIGRSTIPTQQTALLDRGAREGLVLESVVLDAAGVVGRVVELQPATSLVMLLTDPESRVAGLIERSRETGLLVGVARGHCRLIYLDAHADLQEGDRVMTAGLGGPFPKGLLLGTVVQVARDEASGTAWAEVEPAAHLGRLEEVLCLPPAHREVEREGTAAVSTTASRGIE